MSGESILAAALAYASKGWPVFPLRPNSKVPITEHGFKDATTDQVKINAWWAAHPQANVGVVTGNGLGVIDVDMKNGVNGRQSISAANLTIPNTLVSKTPSGGYHLYFKSADKIRCAIGILPGVDIKGDGGYVVGVGSVIAGQVYKWIAGQGLLEGVLPDFPADVLKLLTKPPIMGELRKKTDELRIEQGRRNSTLTSMAGSMRRYGMSERAIMSALGIENETRCTPPLQPAEITTIAKSIGKYAPARIDSAPLATTTCGIKFNPVPADQFVKEKPDPRTWVWKYYLPQGGVSLLAAPAKLGKTTLTAHLVRALVEGKPFLGQETVACPVLFLALEEHPDDVRARLYQFQLNRPDIHVYAGPFRGDDAGCAAILEKIKSLNIGLMIVDTLVRFWAVKDENDAVQVAKGFAPVLALARQTNCAILLLHHTTKAPSDGGREIRGSGDVVAAVDIGLTMARAAEPYQRKLMSYSRYPETPKEMTISLENGAYSATGVAAQRTSILEILSDQPKTSQELAHEANVPEGTVRATLDRLLSEGGVNRMGEGARGNPYRWTKRD